jgi:hypothetical protein
LSYTFTRVLRTERYAKDNQKEIEKHGFANFSLMRVKERVIIFEK